MKKKLLIVISNMFGGGGQRVISRLAYALSADNEIMIMTTPSEKTYSLPPQVKMVYFKDPADTYNGKGGRLGSLIFRLRGTHEYFRQLSAVKRSFKPDATLSFFDHPNIRNALSRGPGRKVMSERNNPLAKGRWYYAYELVSFTFARKVIFQTETVRKMFPACIRWKGVVIPNPVSVSCMATGGSQRIVTVGRRHPQKRHDLLIQAFSRFSETHPNHTLHIYGKTDKNSPDLLPLVERLSLSGKVFFEGFRDDIFEAIADAEQFVLSSDFEGTPNVLLEAMMMGLPCISTAFAGAKEFFGENVPCLTVPLGDIDALASAMARFADDDNLRNDFSRKGMNFADDFSLEKVIPKWYDALFE